MYAGLIRDWPKRVCFGPGSIKELPRLLDDIGARRAAVVCGRSVAGGPILPAVQAALGAAYAGVYDTVPAHTPYTSVQEAAAKIAALGADCVVSVGGGSAIDAGKGVVLLAATAGEFGPYQIDYGAKGSMARAPMPPSPIKHIAIPTTAGSASDVMPTAGIRDPAAGRKMLFWDDRIVPEATILDPEIAVYASPALSAATGMTAVARAIECLYSKHRHPISTGLALHSARLLRTALPRSVEAPTDLAARADCQMAALMSGTASINAMVSLVHAIGHVVGGRFGLQHGISHGILLAPALRRLLPAIGGEGRYVLEALGCAPDGSPEDAAQAMEALLRRLPVPQRLGEVGVKEADLSGIAAATMGDYMMANIPAPMSAADVEALLRSAL
ncbi:MAG: iron-containing alcohol dehydrogenase [Rhodospirillaceae bacterium]|nr:iron-containing alcohol dehydrogenase [Rhodospirillaceae bacterium]